MPPRILQIIDSAKLGGGQHHVLTLVRSLDPDRYSPSVCSGPGGPLVEQLQISGIPHLACPMGKQPEPSTVGRLRKIITGGGFSLVHTHGGVAGLWGRLACIGLPGVKRVHTIHGIHYLNYDSILKKGLTILLERLLARLTDRIICVCHSDLEKALRAGVVSAGQARVILNGIELSPHQEQRPAGGGLRREISLDDDTILIGTVGRLHIQKGQRHLLDAFARLGRRIPGTHLVLIGDGPEAVGLKRRHRGLNLGRHATFLGAREDVADLLPQLDLFVLPSLWEGLPLTLMEAMAAGLAVIATDVDGNSELVEDGFDGILVPSADPEALCGAMAVLCSDPARRKSFGSRARERAIRSFSHHRMVLETSAVYNELLQDS